MFSQMLIATDGLSLSEKAVLAGIDLARRVGARVTAVHVSPRFHVLTYRTDMLEETRSEYEKDARVHAQKYLDFVERAAAAAGVRCEAVREQSDDVEVSPTKSSCTPTCQC
jgi:nucleotide-binding universal stress UspA family protein